MNTNNKLISAIIIVLIVLIGGYLIVKNSKNPVEPVSDATGTQFCFYRKTPASGGLSDVAWLTMHIKDSDVTGEFHNIPAEKDKKTGPFAGTVGPVDKFAMARTASVWWEASAEGVTNKEELSIMFGEGTANIGFGEMVDRGDGLYVYKDPTNLNYSLDLSDITCEVLFEKIAVEDYIRKNISKISTNSAVLGGAWYVVSVDVDTEKNTAHTIYEDGHIQKTEDFKYTRDGNLVNIVY